MAFLLDLKKHKEKMEQVRIRIPSSLKQEIEKYVAAVGGDNISDFFYEAALHVFKMDKKWQTHKANKAKDEKPS